MNCLRMPLLATLLVATAAATLPARAAATVEVNFVEPENFADIGFNTVDRERVLRDLGDFMKQMGEQRLADGQTLRINVTDINLAGELKFTPRGDLRVMKGRADWPEISLRYTLTAGTQTLKSGEVKVYDMAYLQSLRTSESESAQGHEKRMLRRWFDETFGKAVAPQ